jgi:hypothetical protein
MFRLWKRIASTAGLAWELIDKTGSNLTDIETRNHNDLQTIQGGITAQYYHNTEHEDGLIDIIDTQWSTGIVGAGNLVADGGSGTLNVAASSVLLRATNSDTADIQQYAVSAATGMAITDLQNNYIYVEYNAGTPQYVATTTKRTDTNTNVLVATVYHNGTDVHINNYAVVRANDNMRRVSLRFVETQPTAWASGVMLSETGTRNIGITAGVLWQCTNKISLSAFDSSAAGTFIYAYDDGAGGWTEQTAQTQINNTQWDNGSGTLQTLTANRYAVAWVYMEVDGDVIVLYGEGDYTLAQANAATSPSSIPPRISAQGFLVGKIVLQKSAAVFTSVESAFTNILTTATVADHEQLAGLLGGGVGDHYHLTGTQHTDLTDGGLTTLHQHDFNSILFPAGDKIGTPTSVSTLQDLHDYAMSAGVIAGCEVTDNGNGTVAVAAGEAFLRNSASEIATLMLVDVPATNPVSLTDNDANYIYADYAAGTPVVLVTTDVSGFNCLDKCVIAVVGREGTHLHIIEMAHQNVDSNRKHRRKLLETIPFAHIQGGCMLGTSGLKISLTAGGFWFGLEKVTHSAFNTSATDTISTYYRATPSGWTKTTGVTDFPNTQYDDASGTLATLGNNKFGVHWIYVAMGSVPHLALVYGQAEYSSAASAAVATEPESLPPVFESTTLLVGRIVFEKSAAAATAVDSAFHTVFGNSAITVHNNLSALQGGTLNEYYHLTSAQKTVADTVLGASSTAAFDALAPTTTKGDIIVHNGTDNIRLAAGTDTHVLTLDSTQASGVKWAAPASGSNKLAQVVTYQTGTVSTGTTQIPADNTIPQNTEGDQYMTLSITPTNASSQLIIDVTTVFGNSLGSVATTALFQDTTANALAAMSLSTVTANAIFFCTFKHVMTAGTTSSTAFKVRIGPSGASTITFNGAVATQYMGGIMPSRITITEVLP